jgi:type I restriction enzyme, S subunit
MSAHKKKELHYFNSTKFLWNVDIPKHWKFIRLKYLSHNPLMYGANEAALEDNPEWPRFVRITDINNDGSLRAETFKSLPPNIAQPYLLQDSDVLFARSGATVGKTFIYRPEWGGACFAGYLIRFRGCQDIVSSKFIYYFSLSSLYWRQVESGTIQATIQNFSAEKYAGIVVSVPPLSEQTEIADYLDRETARIDALVTEKEHMLALLEEKRAALISRAVTRGLNPDARLKPSDLDWLGDIPAHWGIERAKNLFSVRDQRSETGGEELLTVSHITGVSPRSEKDVYMFQADDKAGYKLCYPGDLVINTLWGWMGAMGISPLEGIVSPDYHVYKSKGQLIPEFVELLCLSKSFVAEVNRWSKGVWSSRLRLYPDNFFEMRLPVPSQEEQHEIVVEIEANQGKAKELRDTLLPSIKIAKERRAALITAAVTGQIPVEEMTA